MKLFTNSPATVVIIGKLMHRTERIMSSPLRYKIDTYVCMYYAYNCCPSLPVDQATASQLLLLPWCTAIDGHTPASRPGNGKPSASSTLVHSNRWPCTSNNNSNSQQQPTTDYKQTTKSLPETCLSTSMKTI